MSLSASARRALSILLPANSDALERATTRCAGASCLWCCLVRLVDSRIHPQSRRMIKPSAVGTRRVRGCIPNAAPQWKQTSGIRSGDQPAITGFFDLLAPVSRGPSLCTLQPYPLSIRSQLAGESLTLSGSCGRKRAEEVRPLCSGARNLGETAMRWMSGLSVPAILACAGPASTGRARREPHWAA